MPAPFRFPPLRLRGVAMLLALGSLWGCGTQATHTVSPGTSSVSAGTIKAKPYPSAELPVRSPAPESSLPLLTPSQNTLPYSAEVASRFPEPEVNYRTPALQGNHSGFTSNVELQNWVRGMARLGAPSVSLLPLGTSQGGVPLEALLFTHNPDATPLGLQRSGRPTVLLVGQQHGDEPAGAEALLVIAQELTKGSLQNVLDSLNVIILPRANPDGAQTGQRGTQNGVDANRDHLLLKTPEAQAQARLMRDYLPVVVVDAHEYNPVGRYFEQFHLVQRYDALLQYAMTPNMPEFITKAAEEWFRQPLIASLKSHELSSEWYYTAAGGDQPRLDDMPDNRVAMGGTQADTGRNVNGLRNAVSFLIETRGAGLDRFHIKRRVYTHVTAITSILSSAAERAADLVRLRQYVDADISAQACQGQVVIDAATTPTEHSLQMLDSTTGLDHEVAVNWDSALVLEETKTRARACGYWLAADQGDAARRLRMLGLRVDRITAVGVMQGEVYSDAAKPAGAAAPAKPNAARPDVRITHSLLDVPVGSFYVTAAQPFSNLAVAALEPDSPTSFLSQGLVTGLTKVARVTTVPNVKSGALP